MNIYRFSKKMEEGEARHNIDKLIGELKHVVTFKDEAEKNENGNITQILDSLVNVSKTSIAETTEFAMDDVFLSLLSHESKEVVAKTAKAIAEIGKTERGREKCTQPELVKTLIELLKEDNIDVLTQTSRALGNICYENESGKKLVRDKGGLKFILTVMRKGVELNNAEGASYLRTVAAGFLLNFFIDHASLQAKALEEDTVSVICSLLELDGIAGNDAAMHALLTLGILNDANLIFLDERLTKVLVDILASDTSSELSETCLELLHGQAEDEKAKVMLAKAGVCELLLKLLEKHGPRCTNEETRSVLKVACNLIILILTGDESMDMLYDNSQGLVYKKLVDWLETNDEDLQVTAVLAMGNFARSDTHCVLMVAQGVHKKLLKLLQANGTKSGDIRFQHALLSALRNLVIPIDNKSVMLSDGLIDVLYPMLDIPTFPVVFKLLGTLRIVIDGQEEAAVSLGKREDLIKRAVEWCNAEDHPGVQGEAQRLIAWLINNGRDKDIALTIIKCDAVKYLVKMLMAQHALMQNEAILSLTILSTACLAEAENLLIEADVCGALQKFFEENADSLELPILYNAISFARVVIGSEALKKHLKSSGTVSALKKTLQVRTEDAELKKKVAELCKDIGSDLD